MKKKVFSILLAALMTCGLSLSAMAEEADKSSPPPASTVSVTNATVPANVKPVKSYVAEVGKKYRLPDSAKKTGDTYATSNSAILTVDKTTGQFKANANGTAYIVATNGTNKRYIKITVGTGKTTTQPVVATGSNALTGYNVTIYDKTTIATGGYYQNINGVRTYCFISPTEKLLGTLSAEDARTIATTNPNVPDEVKERAVWFADQFNYLRGLSGDAKAVGDAAKEEKIEQYCQELLVLINEERAKVGSAPLEVDPDLMAHAQIRAYEITTGPGSHIRPNGERETSECIASGGSNPTDAMRIWKSSPSHWSAITDKDGDFPFTKVGVGCDHNGGNWGWVISFS